MKKIIFLLPFFIFAKNFSFCLSCHNGRKEVDLHSLKKSVIEKRLKELRQKNSTMGYIAKSLSKDDIKEILRIYGKD